MCLCVQCYGLTCVCLFVCAVPAHRVLTEDQKKQLLKRYNHHHQPLTNFQRTSNQPHMAHPPSPSPVLYASRFFLYIMCMCVCV